MKIDLLPQKKAVVVELRRVGEVFSFDCQEFLVPDDDSVIPVHYHPYARFDDANNRSSSERTLYFPLNQRSKDNNIKNESTRYNAKPTKGLDTVDSATGGLLKLLQV